jgi:hypothetical protein
MSNHKSELLIQKVCGALRCTKVQPPLGRAATAGDHRLIMLVERRL